MAEPEYSEEEVLREEFKWTEYLIGAGGRRGAGRSTSLEHGGVEGYGLWPRGRDGDLVLDLGTAGDGIGVLLSVVGRSIGALPSSSRSGSFIECGNGVVAGNLGSGWEDPGTGSSLVAGDAGVHMSMWRHEVLGPRGVTDVHAAPIKR